jgi:hypothetical protein
MGRVILATVEATVDDDLDTTAQRLEESSNGECRSYNNDWRLQGLPGEKAHKRLQTDHEAKIDQGQQDRTVGITNYQTSGAVTCDKLCLRKSEFVTDIMGLSSR